MAPKGSKRPGAPVAAAPRKRAAVAVDPVKEKCAIVAATIREAELEDDVKMMLQEVIPGSLGVPVDARHKFQASVVGMVGETMAGIEAACKRKLAEAQSKVDGAVEDKAARDAKVVDADRHLSESVTAIAEKQEAVKAHAAALDEAEQVVKAALADQAKLDAELEAAVTEKEKLLEAKSSLYGPMKDACADSPAVNKLLAVLRTFGCDEALVTSLPSALKKEPSARGTFDGLALRQFEEWLDRTVAGLADTAASGSSSATERASAVAAATANRDAASERKSTGASDLAEAKSVQKEAAAALKVAQRLVKSFEAEQRDAAKTLAHAKQDISNFEAAMAAFSDLKSRTTPQPHDDAAPVAEGGA